MTTRKRNYSGKDDWYDGREPKPGSWVPGMEDNHCGTYTEEEIEDGFVCPTCTDRGKMKYYSLSDLHVKCLMTLANYTAETKTEYHHIDTLKVWVSNKSGAMKYASSFGGRFALCLKWGLISDMINKDTKKRTAGYWKLEPAGWEFLAGKMMIQKYCHVFRNVIYDYSGGLLSVHDVINSKFDYSECYYDYTGKYWDGERGHDKPNWGDDAQSFLF
tara:strand:- start:244 stop:891 length:648 start_codon:yes stop_codon:yes gene_type:complete